MKISTKGRYALRLMIDLALHSESGYVPIKAIAERQDISDKYLEQIISVLSRAGYVRSVRGAGGGYKLADTPDKYTVGMILRLTEGSLAPVVCLEPEINPCERKDKCPTLFVWQRIYDAVNDVVDNITLAELVEKSKAASESAADNYVI
ncbi:Rrf2 family transcriptional regulator [uncultured Ruminococcus sp.]|uniref:RrF2 family transcriptional regulator n=1 Tax=uncultured Ruminococcus sp. TaxID=165186 RepID=UPI0025D9104A|nr:Rrf2 family transcriptional regulator [uncultured Ruminococcus sp.]